MDRPLKKRRLRAFASAAAATAILLAGACGGGDEPDDGGVETLDQVTYLTGFGTFGREAYAYVAVEKGYFAEEGIEVEIQPGGGTIPNITQTVEGEVDFALADFTGVLLAYGNEQVPLDFTVVGAVLQQTVFSIIALESSGITTPQDLEGMTIGDAPGSFGPLLWPAYAELAGIDIDEVEMEASFPPPELPGLLAGGRVDAIGQFLLGQPTIEAAAGEPAVVLPFSDVLRDLYGIALVVSNDLAESDPDLVQRFNRALMRGLEDAIANPEEAGQILEQHVPEMNGEVAAQEVVLMEPYVQPLVPGAPFGSMDEQRVAQSIAILESAGAIPAGMTPEDVVTFSLVPGFQEQ
jgi:NitT/TauT family transport system substrate-binding protein